MCEDNLSYNILLFLKNNLLFVFIGIVGLIFLGYGLISLLGQSSGSDDISIETNTDSSTTKNPLLDKKIAIDVEGAVVRPGVYQLSEGSRLQDAIIKAGGLSESADKTWVAKTLNLATKLTDGNKVYIPAEGEVLGSTTALTSTTGITGGNGLININSASASQLESLPAVGAVTAEKIISGRPYISIEELVSKKIVGAKTFEKIKEKIAVN